MQTWTNPLPGIRFILENRGWIPLLEAASVVGFQLKLHGMDWRTQDELAKVMGELTDLGFIEIHDDKMFTRLNPEYRRVASAQM